VGIQGSDEWIEQRLGKITASRFAECMKNGRTKGSFSVTIDSYLDELVCEHLTGRQASTVKTYAMDWGTRWEPVAREYYRTFSKHVVEEVGFVQLGERLIGGSPDGLCNPQSSDFGVIEIKCPLTHMPHLFVVETGEMPEEHFWQVQGNMLITGASWCGFVSYHDEFPPELRLCVVRIDRDESAIAELLVRLNLIEQRLKDRLVNVSKIWKGRMKYE
jgi:putative phage-type endonuclease